MKETGLLFSEFANEDGFELNRYLIQLFEYFSTLSKTEDTNTEPSPWREGGFFGGTGGDLQQQPVPNCDFFGGVTILFSRIDIQCRRICLIILEGIQWKRLISIESGY